jgi:hypothetical protein
MFTEVEPHARVTNDLLTSPLPELKTPLAQRGATSARGPVPWPTSWPCASPSARVRWLTSGALGTPEESVRTVGGTVTAFLTARRVAMTVSGKGGSRRARELCGGEDVSGRANPLGCNSSEGTCAPIRARPFDTGATVLSLFLFLRLTAVSDSSGSETCIGKQTNNVSPEE